MASGNCGDRGLCRSVRRRAFEPASLAQQSRLVHETLELAIGARCLFDAMGDIELSPHQLRGPVLKELRSAPVIFCRAIGSKRYMRGVDDVLAVRDTCLPAAFL
jgi:hypothetical protein